PIPLSPVEARLLPDAGPTLFPAPMPTGAEFAAFTLQRTALLFGGTVEDNLIEGTVFLDANFNGQRDEGESGLGNMRAVLEMAQDDGTYTAVKSQLTAPDGQYSFSGLAPGKYRVRLDAPSEMQQTLPSEDTSYTVQLLASTKALER